MSEIGNVLSMDWKNGLLFIAAIIVLSVWIIQKWDFICQRFGVTTKRMMAEEKQDKDIDELKKHAEKDDANFEKIFRSIEELRLSIDTLSDQVSVLQTRNDTNEAARLKDRIGESYRYYHEKGCWTNMEKEAMEEMIHAYSQYSQNSFVHSVVEKEMLTWTVIN